MKTSIKRYLLILIASVICFSCETAIEFNGDTSADLMVLNSFLSPDSVISVHLSKSNFFLDDNETFTLINDAQVKLFVNDVLKETLTSKGQGIYEATYLPKTGERIKITASHSKYGQIEAQTQIENHIRISSCDTSSVATETTPLVYYYYDYKQQKTIIDTVGTNYQNNLNFKINIADSAGYKNYYRAKVYLAKYMKNGDYVVTTLYFDSNDLVFGTAKDEVVDENSNRYNVFNDDIFDGKNYGLSLSIPYNTYAYDKDYEIPDYEKPDYYKQEIIVDIESISKSLYLYLKTREAADNYIEFFSEPVQIYTNVENGIGILGSRTSNQKRVTVPLSYEIN